MEMLILGGAVALWGVAHSWLASTGMKEWTRRWLGEGPFRAYRILYNVISVLSLAPIALLMQRLPDHVLYRVQAPWNYVMLALQASFSALLVLALLQTGPMGFAGVSQLFPRKQEQHIVTTGFYGLTRHPLYLFGLLILWLPPVMSANQLAVSTALTVYIFIGVALEEQRLLREFGAEYADYRSRVPMIFPRLRLWRALSKTDAQD